MKKNLCLLFLIGLIYVQAESFMPSIPGLPAPQLPPYLHNYHPVFYFIPLVDGIKSFNKSQAAKQLTDLSRGVAALFYMKPLEGSIRRKPDFAQEIEDLENNFNRAKQDLKRKFKDFVVQAKKQLANNNDIVEFEKNFFEFSLGELMKPHTTPLGQELINHFNSMYMAKQFCCGEDYFDYFVQVLVLKHIYGKLFPLYYVKKMGPFFRHFKRLMKDKNRINALKQEFFNGDKEIEMFIEVISNLLSEDVWDDTSIYTWMGTCPWQAFQKAHKQHVFWSKKLSPGITDLFALWINEIEAKHTFMRGKVDHPIQSPMWGLKSTIVESFGEKGLKAIESRAQKLAHT